MMVLKFLICTAFFLLISTGAHAQTNPEDTEKLRALFEEFIDHQQSTLAANGTELILDGPLLVEPAKNYYAVTIPPSSIRYPDGKHIDFGMVAINALPTKDTDLWKMSVALPTPILFYNKDNRQSIRIDIGSQRLSGIWHAEMHNFIKLNSDYKNVTITGSDPSFTMTIPHLQSLVDMSETAEGRWSGPANLTLNEITITSPKNGIQADIKKLQADMTVTEYSLKERDAYQDKMSALAESYQKDTASLSHQHITGLYNTILEFIGSVWDGFSLDVEVQELEIQLPGNAPSYPGKAINLQNAGISYNISGFRKNDVTFALNGHYDGLSISPLPDEFSPITPTEAAIDISINHLPYQELIEIGRSSLKTASSSSGGTKTAKQQALMTAPQLLTQAGTGLNMTNTFVGNGRYNAHLNATIITDAKASMGVTGKSQIEIRGLNPLIEYAKEQIQSPKATEVTKNKTDKIVQILTILQMMGQQKTDKKGRAIHAYDFELTKDGQALLNGANINALIPDEAKK